MHLPKAWKSKWNLGVEVLPTDVWANEAVQRARNEFSLSGDVKLDCRRRLEEKYACMHMRKPLPMSITIGTLATLVLC